MTKKLLSLALALALVLAMGATAFAAGYGDLLPAVKTIPADYTGKTIILHSNDVHGAIDGYASIAGLRDQFLDNGATDVILVDAGDFSQGSVYVSTTKGKAAVDMMNAAYYDFVTLGNHEFDFGTAQLLDNLKDATFSTLCCNVTFDETGETIVPAYGIWESGTSGLKIGFVGIETPETATKVNPGIISDISIAAFDKLYETTQKAVDDVKADGNPDLVIALAHLGVLAESAPNGYRSVDLLDKVTGIDFTIDGHSHTVMTGALDGKAVQSTGTKFAYVGVVVIDDATKTIEDNYLLSTASLPKNEEVAAKAQEIMDEIDAVYASPFATTEVNLNGEKADNRSTETNLGDLIADAMVWSVVSEGGIEQVEPNQVIGITNGGGIRASIPAGDVSMKDINNVLPFGNTVTVIYVTGDELLEALEASTFATPEPIGGFPQTSGIEWTLDTTVPYAQGAEYTLNGKDTSYFGPTEIKRVSITAINGEPFDPASTYAVVTNNFIAAGGDTYNVFNRAYVEGSGFDTGIPMDQVVQNYIADVLNGVISAETYGEPQGRMTLIAGEAAEEEVEPAA